MLRLAVIDLDLTLGCGQVFRWYKEGDWWSGVIDNAEVRLRRRPDGVDVRGGASLRALGDYLRADDDLEAIYDDISRDDFISSLARTYRGLRLVRQDPWECAASYILASYANLRRIQGMVESVCREFGRRLEGGRYTFPTPGAILDGRERAEKCGLGYRCDWLLDLAEKVEEGEVDFQSMREMGYHECVRGLKQLKGVGDKVADCIALFSLDHMCAFPLDVRIKRAVRVHYGWEGSYSKIRSLAQKRFGEYAGYAQEFIYLSEGRCVTEPPATIRTEGTHTRGRSSPPEPRRS